jgi:hypothetical protein
VTKAERDTIVALYRDGLALDLIAAEVRRGHHFVRQVLTDCGVPIRPKGGRRSFAERRAIMTRCQRNRVRPPSGYDVESEEERRAAAALEATRLPEWLLALPARDIPIDRYPTERRK